MREVRRLAAGALLSLSALLALTKTPPAARAADLVDLHGPFLDDTRLIAFRASLDYRWLSRELAVRREVDCLAHEVIDGASLFVAVDYPGLNLRLCEYARKRGVPVLYDIAPQVWAWGAGRVDRMRK